MQIQQTLDSLPIPTVFLALVLGAILAYECGFRIGRWWQNRTPEETEGPTPMIVGSLLALLGFLLAITMGMASDRFETRRALVLAEANAIGTAYLRAGYLPDSTSGQIRDLLREYVPLHILSDHPTLAEISAKAAQSAELQSRLWSVAESLARSAPESPSIALFIDSLNEMFDLHESRVTAVTFGRVPETVFMLLVLSSVLTLASVGYNSGLRLRRSSLVALMMILFLSSVLTLVVDLDRPREGFLKANQQPLIDLAAQIGAT